MNTKKQFVRNLKNSCCGVSLVSFALVAPIIFSTFVLGLDAVRVYYTEYTIRRALSDAIRGAQSDVRLLPLARFDANTPQISAAIDDINSRFKQELASQGGLLPGIRLVSIKQITAVTNYDTGDITEILSKEREVAYIPPNRSAQFKPHFVATVGRSEPPLAPVYVANPAPEADVDLRFREMSQRYPSQVIAVYTIFSPILGGKVEREVRVTGFLRVQTVAEKSTIPVTPPTKDSCIIEFGGECGGCPPPFSSATGYDSNVCHKQQTWWRGGDWARSAIQQLIGNIKKAGYPDFVPDTFEDAEQWVSGGVHRACQADCLTLKYCITWDKSKTGGKC
jgi:hypothetical protein